MVHSEGFVEGVPFGTVLVAGNGGTRAAPAAEEELLIAVETRLDVGENG